MQIILNGKPKEVAAGLTISELLKQLRLDIKQVVVERNASIVAKQGYERECLNDGDNLEIVHFVGGG
ncbi:MAG: sulfur carrier protein ThiS [Desulfuromonadales bacterium]|nr:sulfur carrier protein ThiS [Desulfuromonadales bacterium]